jgi:hypothetical protein
MSTTTTTTSAGTNGARVMRLVTGEARPIVKVYPDGAFNCPWCGAANDAGAEHCANPGCWASSHADADQVRAAQQQYAQAQAAVAQRQADIATAARMAQEARNAEEQLWQKVSADAAEHGACLTCLRRSPWRASRPRFIRHRRADFHEQPESGQAGRAATAVTTGVARGQKPEPGGRTSACGAFTSGPSTGHGILDVVQANRGQRWLLR